MGFPQSKNQCQQKFVVAWLGASAVIYFWVCQDMSLDQDMLKMCSSFAGKEVQGLHLQDHLGTAPTEISANSMF
eukprot:6489682-Amphidinium_carterae.1